MSIFRQKIGCHPASVSFSLLQSKAGQHQRMNWQKVDISMMITWRNWLPARMMAMWKSCSMANADWISMHSQWFFWKFCLFLGIDSNIFHNIPFTNLSWLATISHSIRTTTAFHTSVSFRFSWISPSFQDRWTEKVLRSPFQSKVEKHLALKRNRTSATDIKFRILAWCRPVQVTLGHYKIT